MGLYKKYTVIKAGTPGEVANCFVLEPLYDSAARIALEAYTDATSKKNLAADIYQWLDELNYDLNKSGE